MMKLTNLRKQLEKEQVDALLITNPFNRRYMTGFTGTAGVVLISMDAAVFITDFRYTEQAEKEINGFTIVQHTRTIIEEVAQQVEKMNVQTLGFEKDDCSFGLYELYKKEVNAELKPTSGIIEKLRMIKTDDEIAVLKQAAKIADDTFSHILTFIRPGVTELDVSNELEFFMRKQGATSSSFSIIVASGLRSALPHGVATDKVIESGDFVTLDLSLIHI